MPQSPPHGASTAKTIINKGPAKDRGQCVEDGRGVPHRFSGSAVRHASTTSNTIVCPSIAKIFGFSYYDSGVDKRNGKPVIDHDIKDWADEAERGYDVERLRKRGRKPLGNGPAQVVPVRIHETHSAALTERADHDHEGRSEAIRAAIRAYVA